MNNSKVFRVAKWFLIIMLAGLAGIFLGRSMMRYETRLMFSRTYCGSYRGIDVYKCGELNDENAVSYLLMLERAPEALVEKCSSLYLTGGSLDVPEMSGEAGYALGLTQDTTVFITTDCFFADVLYHELFHAFDNAQGKISDSDEFRKIYDRERSMVRVECLVEENDRAEFFASAGADYLLDPVLLQSMAPETYKYIKTMLNEDIPEW